jgi:hypothetical protein
MRREEEFKQSQESVGKLRQVNKNLICKMTGLKTLNDNLHMRMAQDKQVAERTLQEPRMKAEFFKCAKDRREDRYRTSKSPETRIEEELSSSLYRDREKLRSLTEELRFQKVEVKALQLMHAADEKTIAIRDARIQELVNANEKQRVSATAEGKTNEDLRLWCNDLHTSNIAYQQENEDLEGRCASQKDELDCLTDRLDKTEERFRDLESSAVERKLLRKADTRSRKHNFSFCS